MSRTEQYVVNIDIHAHVEEALQQTMKIAETYYGNNTLLQLHNFPYDCNSRATVAKVSVPGRTYPELPEQGSQAWLSMNVHETATQYAATAYQHMQNLHPRNPLLLHLLE